MGSTQESIQIDNLRERVYKNRQRRCVVFRELNQDKCANTSEARCRSCFEEPETEKPGPTP